MISIITAAAFALAWFGFRYERHRRWRADVDAAYGTLRAVHHGMVQGLTPGQAVGWGQIYFSNIYTEEVAQNRPRWNRPTRSPRYGRSYSGYERGPRTWDRWTASPSTIEGTETSYSQAP